MPQELIQLDANKRLIRIALIVLIVFASLWSYFAFRWYIGNTMAEYFNTGDNSLDLAQVAQNLAPNDPITSWRLAEVSQKRLPLDQSAVALSQFEKAVGLSPNDYRFWLALGIAREQAGDTSGGEQALRRAVALAPSYANPRWHLGNLLLRTGRYDEAFAELRSASEADPENLRSQMFNLVWEVNNTDFESLVKGVGAKSESRAQFALYLLGYHIDEGLRMWNSLNAYEKKANKPTGDQILTTLITRGRFHDAMILWNDLVPVQLYRVEEGKITDGGFEDQISYTPDFAFAWQVRSVGQMEIGIDPAISHSGTRSLRLVFQVRSQLDAIQAGQIVPVAKNTEYEFECYIKTNKLQTGGPPIIHIVDLNGGVLLASSDPAPSGDTDWSRIGLPFKTSDKTEAIAIGISRAACEDKTMCPIFGTIWYDDFSLKRRN